MLMSSVEVVLFVPTDTLLDNPDILEESLVKIIDLVTVFNDVSSPILLVQSRVRNATCTFFAAKVTLLSVVEHATVVPLVSVPMASYAPSEPLK